MKPKHSKYPPRVVFKPAPTFSGPVVYQQAREQRKASEHIRAIATECRCTFAQRMVGDGCDVCNPGRAYE